VSPNDAGVQAKVIDALAEPTWDFRTADGISEETGIPVDVVSEVLSGRRDAIRVSHAPDRHGRLVYTLRDRPVTVREGLATLRQSAILV